MRLLSNGTIGLSINLIIPFFHIYSHLQGNFQVLNVELTHLIVSAGMGWNRRYWSDINNSSKSLYMSNILVDIEKSNFYSQIYKEDYDNLI